MKTIVLTGPESTGKTWLAGLLAGHFDTTWCPEYLREYYHQTNSLIEEDLEIVAKGQISEEKKLMQLDYDFIFLDTNIISLKVYNQYYFKTIPNWFETLYQPNLYHHYLLLDTSVPWVEDPQRDSPEVRELLFLQFKNELDELKLPYSIISGDYDERLETAKKKVVEIISE